jgi:hypothetical protein
MNITNLLTATPTLTVAANYASGDYVGTSAVAMTFTGAATPQSNTGTIISAILIDYAAQSVSTELWLFDAAPTPPADSAAWTVTDADMLKCIGIIPFTTYYASGANVISFAKGVGIAYKTATGNLFGCLVTRGTPTYASGDVTVRLVVWQD